MRWGEREWQIGGWDGGVGARKWVREREDGVGE